MLQCTTLYVLEVCTGTSTRVCTRVRTRVQQQLEKETKWENSKQKVRAQKVPPTRPPH